MSDRLKTFLDSLEDVGKESDGTFRLKDLVIRRVDLVDHGANKRRFLIVKRDGEKKTSSFEHDGEGWNPVDPAMAGLGPDVIENPDGTFSEVGKAELAMPASEKQAALQVLAEAMQRGAALMDSVKNAREDDAASVPAELGQQGQEIGRMLMSLSGTDEERKAQEEKEKEERAKATDEEKEKEEAEKAKQEEDEKEDEEDLEMKKLEDGGFQIGDKVYTGGVAKYASQLAEELFGMSADVQKAGRRIKASRLKELRDILGKLNKLITGLDPQLAKFAGVFKGFDNKLDDLKKENAQMREMLAKYAGVEADETIPAGSAAGPGDGGRVKKAADEKPDTFIYGQDFNQQIAD